MTMASSRPSPHPPHTPRIFPPASQHIDATASWTAIIHQPATMVAASWPAAPWHASLRSAIHQPTVTVTAPRPSSHQPAAPRPVAPRPANYRSAAPRPAKNSPADYWSADYRPAAPQAAFPAPLTCAATADCMSVD